MGYITREMKRRHKHTRKRRKEKERVSTGSEDDPEKQRA